jgi:hypothetical protein
MNKMNSPNNIDQSIEKDKKKKYFVSNKGGKREGFFGRLSDQMKKIERISN